MPICSTIPQQLAFNAAHHGDDIWLTSPETARSYSWSQAYEAASQIASALLSKGVGMGETVALAAPNSLGATLSFIAITMTGGRATPINLVAGVKVMAYVLAHSKTNKIIVDDDYIELISQAIEASGRDIEMIRLDRELGAQCEDDSSCELPSLSADDPALLIYTSGTTGNPKGVLLSHKNLLSAGENVAIAHQLSSQDKGLCVLPIYHINGLAVTVMGTLVSHSGLVMPYRFSNSRFWQEILDYHCSWFSAVPTLFTYILNEDKTPDLSTSHLRFARSASAPLPPEIHRKFEKRFGVPIIETMGLTETGAQILSNPLPPMMRKIGSPGIAMGNEVKIIHPETEADLPPNSEGEIVVRGANVMLGYLDQPEATAKSFTADGWLKSGDLGKMDDDGFIFVTGRIKELIIKGGENIAPREIDEVLLEHEAVLEAAAFARPCDNYGQTVEACIRLKDGYQVEQSDLLDHCHARLGAFKSPDIVHVLDDLPKGPSGKVQRLKLIGLVD